MNPFERHGITHLSPSSLNAYAANPALWCGRYLLGWKDDMGPAAHRGSAIEAGLDVFLYERKTDEAIARALDRFAELTQGVADDETEAERLNITPMLEQAMKALSGLPIPNARQLRCEYYAGGVEVPIIGYLDYVWDDFGLDLKTTKSCPSAIKSDHARQFAMYAAAKQKPWKCLYVTAKKFALLTLEDADAEKHLRDLEQHARSVRHLLKKAEDGADALKFFPVERSDFRWSDKTLDLVERALENV
jgi:hypothetical protein